MLKSFFLTIPDSVASIGHEAFSGCYSLETITLTNSVEYIYREAFSKCAISEIVLPDSLTEISGYMFSDCYYLFSITIPDSVSRIQGGAFSNCNRLETIVVPDSVAYIDVAAFNCKNLESITILNPNCKIKDTKSTILSGVIKGYKGSTAEEYAKKYNRQFIAYDTSNDTPGDVNCDGTVSIADIVSLQNFLLGRTKSLGNWKNADLCKDNRLDAFDMILMRRLLIEKMS